MRHQVLRPFQGAERAFHPGQIIDTSDWRTRNVRGLVQGRYLQLVPDAGAVPLPKRGVAPSGQGKE